MVKAMDAAHAQRAREKAARRAAQRQRLTLHKSRQRDSRGVLFGTWEIRDGKTGERVSGDPVDGYGMSLEAVEQYLNAGRS